jgi:uncharacterized pyridoxamine 5'-phosphate oxidase family protein
MQSLLKPNSKFLTGIIPNNWVEVIFEYENYYLIHVTGDATTEEEWENYELMLREEFQENFDEIYRLPEDNLVFQVFLHKNNSQLV